jgi:transcriptional regulator with XRE-family HTH domain
LASDEEGSVEERRGGVGGKVRELRTVRGWTQERLSERSGVPQTTISQVEVGRIARPSWEIVAALARALGVRADVLWEAAGLVSVPEVERPALADLVAWLESRPDLVEQLEEVRRENPPEVYRQFLEGLASAWEADIRMALRLFRLGEHRGLAGPRPCS